MQRDWLDHWEVEGQSPRRRTHGAAPSRWRSVLLWTVGLAALGATIYFGIALMRNVEFGGGRRVVPVPAYRQSPPQTP